VSPWIIAAAAAALAPERLCYVWVARAPHAFRRWCARLPVSALGEPVVVVRKLFYAFKLLQAAVFVGWCHLHGNGVLVLADRDPAALVAGGVLIAAGQALNWSVFYRLGVAGVFYGDRLGHPVEWCRAFPFSVFAHPQYVGVVLSIWGFFMAMRYPHPDWMVLPAVETMFYATGAWLEERRPIGIDAIPEISMVGAPEHELTGRRVPYESGVARYREIARGQIPGDHSGMFRMLFHREDRRLLGIHCIGTGATELVHVGQAVLALGGGLDQGRPGGASWLDGEVDQRIHLDV
jgi:methylene-fatty-acyl-phospholipid synthase